MVCYAKVINDFNQDLLKLEYLCHFMKLSRLVTLKLTEVVMLSELLTSKIDFGKKHSIASFARSRGEMIRATCLLIES